MSTQLRLLLCLSLALIAVGCEEREQILISQAAPTTTTRPVLPSSGATIGTSSHRTVHRYDFAAQTDRFGLPPSLSGITASAWGNGVLYMWVDDMDLLVSWSPATDSLSAIGRAVGNREDDIEGLCFDANTGVLYAVDATDATLVRMDPATAHTTVVGTYQQAGFTGTLQGLAYDPTTATLYAVDTVGDQLLTLDTTTAGPTIIGPLGGGGRNVQGLTYDTNTGILWGNDTQQNVICQIDTSTGTATNVSGGPAALGDPRSSLAVAPDSTLYVVDPGTHRYIGTADPTDGTITVVRLLSTVETRGMAYDRNNQIVYMVDQAFQVLRAYRPGVDAFPRYVGTMTNVATVFSCAFDPNANVLYAVDVSTNPDNLVTIDVTTAAGTIIGGITSSGPVNENNIQGLAYDPNNDILYACDDDDDVLLTIDTTTANATVVGPLGTTTPTGLSYDPDADILYLVDRSSVQLLSVDVTTGATTEVQSTLPLGLDSLTLDSTQGVYYANRALFSRFLTLSPAANDAADPATASLSSRQGVIESATAVAHDPASGTTYAVVGTALGTLDAGTGTFATRVLLNEGNACNVDALAYDGAAGILYGWDKLTATLVRIDATTGRFTPFDQFPLASPLDGAAVEALAFDANTGSLFTWDSTSGAIGRRDGQTGSWRVLASTSFTALGLTSVFGLTFDPTADLLIAFDDNTDNWITLDPWTGEVLGVWQSEAADIQGLGFIP